MITLEVKPGTGKIDTLTIRNNRKTSSQDLRQLVKELGYYESIFSPSVSVTIVIQDGTDMKNSLPIVGGETIDISFSDSFPGTVDIDGGGTMRVYKISDRVKESDKVDSYTLLCTTNDFINSHYKIVDRTYTRKSAKNIVSDILKEKFGQELFNDQEVKTEGIHTFTFTQINPFKAINQILLEAQSVEEDKASSIFCFWQNNDGYQLQNLDILLRKEPRKDETGETLKYAYFTGEVPNDYQFESSRILDVRETVSFDFLNGIAEGQYGTMVKYYDPIAKQFRNNQYTHDENWEDNIHANKNPLLSKNISEEFGRTTTVEKYLTTNAVASKITYVSDRDVNIRTSSRRRQNVVAGATAIMSRITNNSIDIMVYGDSRIMAGETIDITMPTTGQKKKTDELIDNLTSGRYLITAVKHSISDDEYYTIMTVVKDSYIKNPDRMGDF
jgi:hypothetical protein